jgi:hypothetical protein
MWMILFQNNSLELTVNNYNFLRNKTRSVEFRLIEDELKEMDLQLERAEHALNWNSEGNQTPVLIYISTKKTLRGPSKIHLKIGGGV